MPDADGDVLVGGFIDSYWSWVDGDDNPLAYGFVDLVYVLETLVDEWPEDTENDTAIVLACHSHGCVWLHTALLLVPDLRVAALVDIDAESYEWEFEWASEIEADGQNWDWDISYAADAWDIPGQSDYQDVEDVVADRVDLNLEIASDDGTWLQDGESNHRLDGSDDSIRFFQSAENHENSDGADSDGITWATERLSNILD